MQKRKYLFVEALSILSVIVETKETLRRIEE